jgi:hypothetical protein
MECVIWIGCAGCGALLVRWISRTLLHMGWWNILIRRHVQSPDILIKRMGIFYKMEFVTRFLVHFTGEPEGWLDKLLLTTSAN